MLTPSDLRNPKRQSGFDHVNANGEKNSWRAASGGKRRISGGPETVWRGATRKTALEAAQDYCDYVNGHPTRRKSRKRRAGHVNRARVRVAPVDPEVAYALGVLRDKRAQRDGRQGYVYCIGECVAYPQRQVGWTAVKIGYSTNPQARVAELQTGNPRVLKLLGYFPGTMDDEGAMHAKYAHLNVLDEWFQPTGSLMSEFGCYADGTKKGA